MNPIIEKIASTLIAFCVIVTLDTPALAGDLNTNFADVMEDSHCYESVRYFAEEQVIWGTKDGLFHPESAMTLGEWDVILDRFQRLPKNKIFTDKRFLKRTGSSKPTAILPPGIVYSSIWEAAGIKTYTAREYGFASSLDAGTTAMLTAGLINRDAVGQTSITRGEALRLLYEVAVKKLVTSVPPNLIGFFDVSTDCEEPEEAEAMLRKLLEAYPNSQLALLLAYDYRFEIWDDLSSLPVKDSETLLGLEDDGQHVIYLEKDAVSQWTLHETGHAVETCNSSYSKSIALNKMEREPGMKLLKENGIGIVRGLQGK